MQRHGASAGRDGVRVWGGCRVGSEVQGEDREEVRQEEEEVERQQEAGKL